MGKDKDISILNLATSIMSNTDSSEDLKDKVREYFETTSDGLSKIIIEQNLLSKIIELSDHNTSIMKEVFLPNSQFELGETLKSSLMLNCNKCALTFASRMFSI